jgi:hypothetical protein
MESFGFLLTDHNRRFPLFRGLVWQKTNWTTKYWTRVRADTARLLLGNFSLRLVSALRSVCGGEPRGSLPENDNNIATRVAVGKRRERVPSTLPPPAQLTCAPTVSSDLFQSVARDDWHHVHNHLSVDEMPRADARARHQAWLYRRRGTP